MRQNKMISHSLSMFFILLFLPLIASCSQDEQGTSWSSALMPLQSNFSISERFKQQQEAFDFNADGLVDYIYYVDVTGNIETISNDISLDVVQPWLKMDEQKKGSKTGVVIIHGGDVLSSLIHDKNDVSILDASAMLQSKVIKKDRIKFIEEAELISKAKGDIILIPTEAGIDSFIYWDGLTYQLYEVIDIP
jgi:hypothetical protein